MGSKLQNTLRVFCENAFSERGSVAKHWLTPTKFKSFLPLLPNPQSPIPSEALSLSKCPQSPIPNPQSPS
ncbi:hypothetical protein ACQFX9_17665 [Aliinostoc sp. HNIBRCY26]|uniref:hypothetical protein n=1 Tax=Aliinostoc sp. HNIBRCY26 TaxID=3418997 RepID=UPI003D0312D8